MRKWLEGSRFYKFPPRKDNKITTKGPAATTRSNDPSWKTISKLIIKNYIDLNKKLKSRDIKPTPS